MGNILALLTKAWDSLASVAPESRILMLGLDAAGKTTILYKFKLGETVTSIPTLGFHVESINYKGLEMSIWDVGGQERLRSLWSHYYEGSSALIWVVDSGDRERLEESGAHLHRLLQEDDLKDASLLVLANKQDMPNALSCGEIANAFGLGSLKNRDWFVQATNAPNGDGLYEGLDWLARSLKSKI